nr:SHOCT domain-containing protein [Ardenticatena sp.]
MMGGMMGGIGNMMGGMGGWFGFGGLWMILFWVILILLVVWIITRLFPQIQIGNETLRQTGPGYANAPHAQAETPLDILKKRYARGEITREEFERMRQDLEA